MTHSTIAALIEFLNAVESRDAESFPDFELPDPTPGTHDLFVANAEFPIETHWIVCRRHSGKHAYLGHGDDRRYTDCCIFGCPETVRRDCVLSRDAVIDFATMLPNIEQLPPTWQWVSFKDMYQDK